MLTYFKNVWQVLTKKELWFGGPSVIIWLIAFGHMKSWADWWRPLFAILFFVFIAMMAGLQHTIEDRRKAREATDVPSPTGPAS